MGCTQSNTKNSVQQTPQPKVSKIDGLNAKNESNSSSVKSNQGAAPASNPKPNNEPEKRRKSFIADLKEEEDQSKQGKGKPWIGIDIGSTYTRAFIWNPLDESVEPVRSETGETSMPTKVAFESSGDFIIG